jgi:hypothetical protein
VLKSRPLGNKKIGRLRPQAPKCNGGFKKSLKIPVNDGNTALNTIGSPVGGPHSLGEIRGAAAVNVLSRLFAFAFTVHGGALELLCSIMA